MLNRAQTFALALVLTVAAVVLIVTGHSDMGALALGGALGAITPTDPTGRG